MNHSDNDDKPAQSKEQIAVALLVLAGLIVFLLAVAAWTGAVPAWTGFQPFDPDVAGPRARTLWEWMGLLIVPAALALGALWFNRSQKRLEIKLARESRDLEQKIATDRQQQVALEAYYDRMTDLLLNHNLRGSAANAEERSIARALTLTVLRGLDGERKTQAFRFLDEAGLLVQPGPVVRLVGADLSGVHIPMINLAKASLGGTNLSGAMLYGANLSGSSLKGGKLIAADLTGADLPEAILAHADLSGARLIEVNLTRAELFEANLSGADLFNANLFEAKMSGANLAQVNLVEANLLGANYTQTTIWPDGFDPAAAGAVLVDGPQPAEA